MAGTPRVRFKEFTDVWEQRKVGELIEDYTERTVMQNQYPVLTSSQQQGIVFQEDYFADRQVTTNDNIGYFVLPRGYFTYRSRSDTDVFVFNRNDVIDKGIISYYYPVFRVKDTDSDFLLRRLNYGIRSQLSMAAEGTGQKVLAHGKFKQMIVDVPSFGEQEKIGKIFAVLDHLITLHQRKCDEIIELKKYMLQKMFPQNDKKNPEIRFAKFIDDWEQRKALELAEYSKGNGYSKGDLTEVGTPIILYGRLYTKYQFAINEVDTFVIPKSGSVYSQGNEVIVPASGETAEDIARASAVEKSGVLLGGDLNILSPFNFINPLFLALAISNGEPQKELAKKAQGKSVVHIHNSDIQEVTISYPLRSEQDQIVAVFRHLDHLITLHQRKCDALKGVKKFMLQNMFPQKG